MWQYIKNTFASARNNISINGMQPQEVEEQASAEGKKTSQTDTNEPNLSRLPTTFR